MRILDTNAKKIYILPQTDVNSYKYAYKHTFHSL